VAHNIDAAGDLRRGDNFQCCNMAIQHVHAVRWSFASEWVAAVAIALDSALIVGLFVLQSPSTTTPFDHLS
jgi:hypothetical protein